MSTIFPPAGRQAVKSNKPARENNKSILFKFFKTAINSEMAQ